MRECAGWATGDLANQEAWLMRFRSTSARAASGSVVARGLSVTGAVALVLGTSGAVLGATGVVGSAAPAGAATSHAAAHAAPHAVTTPQSPQSHGSPHAQSPLLGTAPHLAAATPAHTFTVNTTNDTHDATPGDGICADSTGQCSLRAAIEEADAEGVLNPVGETIEVDVPSGTYTLTLGTQLDATYPDGLDIVGAGAVSTRIQQAPSPTDRVLEVNAASPTAGADVMLSGVTLQGGNVADGGGILVPDSDSLLQLDQVIVIGNTAGLGGGIDNGGQLWVSNSSIYGNTADDSASQPRGGGIYSDGQVSLTNTLVNNNNATSTAGHEADGGGIYNQGSLLVEGGYVSSNSVSSNASAGAFGGGIFSGDTTELTGVTIDSNSVSANTTNEDAEGGGIFADFQLASIANSTISGNVADGHFAQGGALASDEGGSNITGSTIENNQANGHGAEAVGGAIATTGSGDSVNLSNSIVSGNSATDLVDGAFGGALAGTNGAPVNVSASTLNGNTATGSDSEGGAIWIDFASVAITGSTLDNNSANDPNGEGGALWAISGGGGFFGDSVTGTSLSGNSAGSEGGAVFDEMFSTTFTNDQVTQNQVTNSGTGGGLYLDDGGTVTGTNVSSNSAAGGDGGGIYNDSPLILRTSTVADNTASFGGGLYVDDGLQAENATIAGNSTSGAGDQGGGVYLDGGTLSLRFVTVNGNTSDGASAIFNNGSGAAGGAIGSSIVQSGCAATAGAKVIASGGHNVLGDSSCAAPVSNDKAGVANFLLTPLGNNGGPAPTMVPLTGSAAIGQGGTICPATDERGVSRPQGAACTAGAVEAGQAYWEVASDGGIFSFGGAQFFGSMGGKHLNAPIVGIAGVPDGSGYWEVASDGGVFTFGTPSSTAPWAASRSMRRSSASPRRRTARATGRWRPTAASSATATPSSTARWAAST